NGGRWQQSHPLGIFVNGPIKVRIVEPKPGTLLAPGSDLTAVAEAIHPAGQIKEVEFFVAHGISVGKATPEPDNRFTLKLKNIHRSIYDMEVVATDAAGLISKSSPVTYTASNPPTVSIATPAERASFVAPANIDIVLNYKCTTWLNRIEVFANDELIQDDGVGSSSKRQYSFKWKNVKAGKYVLKAVVLDDFNMKAESSSVNIVVRDRR
ncbi:MAG TPA: Ig-like domain-containing protein, partial [Pyrinomonadaceae bacterium]|nr:Ig-like domain-containing protein [Pyrinomonadaceae bacterium]